MITYTTDELKEILNSHAEWLNGSGGQRADLSYVDLSYVDLSYADLSNANLRGVDLSYADLSYADLTGANLCGADLSHADLTGTNLTGANLNGADLIGAGGNEREVRSSYIHPWCVVYTNDIVAIGCEQHSKSDWLKFTDAQISEMDPRALKWWKGHKPKLIDMGIF